MHYRKSKMLSSPNNQRIQGNDIWKYLIRKKEKKLKGNIAIRSSIIIYTDVGKHILFEKLYVF